METKKCTKCETEKQLEDFSKGNRGRSSKYRSVCKACDAARMREWRAKYNTHYRAYCKRRYRENPEYRAKRLQYEKERRAKNPEYFKQHCKDWYYRNHQNPEFKRKASLNGKKQNLKPRLRFEQCKRGAKKRGYEFMLTLETFTDLTSQPCYYCGGFTKADINGLDRIDNSKGYEVDNVAPCCKCCNLMKRDHSVDEFINKCQTIANNRDRNYLP